MVSLLHQSINPIHMIEQKMANVTYMIDIFTCPYELMAEFGR